jgi:hypothetical protein
MDNLGAGSRPSCGAAASGVFPSAVPDLRHTKTTFGQGEVAKVGAVPGNMGFWRKLKPTMRSVGSASLSDCE